MKIKMKSVNKKYLYILLAIIAVIAIKQTQAPSTNGSKKNCNNSRWFGNQQEAKRGYDDDEDYIE